MEAIRDLEEENLLLTQFRILGFRDAEGEEVCLEPGATLFGSGDDIDAIWFPRRPLLVSILRSLENGAMVEVGMAGFDGMLGLHALSHPMSSPGSVVVQNGGGAVRMPVASFRDIFDRSEGVRSALFRYQNYFTTHLAQSAVCNRFHTVEARLARWILMVRDRTCCDSFEITQESVAQVLGVRLASVNEAVGALVENGALNHGRSRLTIVDPWRLEQHSCECYFILAKEQRRLLSPTI